MISLQNFKESIKIQNLDQYLANILDVYMFSGTDFNSKYGQLLRNLFTKDSTSAGMLNQTDLYNFYEKKLVKDFMIRNGLFDEYLAETDLEKKALLHDTVAKEISNSLTNYEKYIVLDSVKLCDSDIQGDAIHQFSLNVDADNIIKVIRSLYETASTNNIPFFITYPCVVDQVAGVNDFISVACSNENLGNTLKLFEMLPDEIKSMCKTPCPFGSIVDGWIGYSSIEGQSFMTDIVGILIIRGIDHVIVEFTKAHPEVAQGLDANLGVDNVRVMLLQLMKNSYPEYYGKIVEVIKEFLIKNNIDLDNLFLSKNINLEITQEVDPLELKTDAEENVIPEGLIPTEVVVEQPQVVAEAPVMEQTSMEQVIPVVETAQAVTPAEVVAEQPVMDQSAMVTQYAEVQPQAVAEVPVMEQTAIEQVIPVIETAQVVMPTEVVVEQPVMDQSSMVTQYVDVQPQAVVEAPVMEQVIPVVETAQAVMPAEVVVEQPVASVMPVPEIPVIVPLEQSFVEPDSLIPDGLFDALEEADKHESQTEPVMEAQPQVVVETSVMDQSQPVVMEQPVQAMPAQETVLLAQDMSVGNTVSVAANVVANAISDVNRVVYNQMGITNEQLNSLVKDENGVDVTLYTFLEKNNTLNKIPVNARVILSTDVNSNSVNNVMSGADFICGPVVKYATMLGNLSVDGIIEKYATEIKLEEEKKKTFFGGLFKKK